MLEKMPPTFTGEGVAEVARVITNVAAMALTTEERRMRSWRRIPRHCRWHMHIWRASANSASATGAPAEPADRHPLRALDQAQAPRIWGDGSSKAMQKRSDAQANRNG